MKRLNHLLHIEHFSLYTHKLVVFMAGIGVGLAFSMTLHLPILSVVIFSLLFSVISVFCNGVYRSFVVLASAVIASGICFSIVLFLIPSVSLGSIAQIITLLFFLALFTYLLCRKISTSPPDVFTSVMEIVISVCSLLVAVTLFINSHKVPLNHFTEFATYEDNDAWLSYLGVLNHGAFPPTLIAKLNGSLLPTFLSYVSILTNGIVHKLVIVKIPTILVSTYEFVLVSIPLVVGGLLSFSKNIKMKSLVPPLYLTVTFFFLVNAYILIFGNGSLDSGLGLLFLILSAPLIYTFYFERSSINFFLACLSPCAAGLCWFPLLPISVLLLVYLGATYLRESFNQHEKFSHKKLNYFLCALLGAVVLVTLFLDLTRGSASALLTLEGGVTLASFAEILGAGILLLAVCLSYAKNLKNLVSSPIVIYLLSLLLYLFAVAVLTYIKAGNFHQYGLEKLLNILVISVYVVCPLLILINYESAIFGLFLLFFVIVTGIFYSPNVLSISKAINNIPTENAGDLPWLDTAFLAINENPTKKVFCISAKPMVGRGLLNDWDGYYCERFVSSMQGLESLAADESIGILTWKWRSMAIGSFPSSFGESVVKNSKPGEFVFVFIGSKTSNYKVNEWSKGIYQLAINKHDKIYYTTSK